MGGGEKQWLERSLWIAWLIQSLILRVLTENLFVCVCMCVCVWERERERERKREREPLNSVWLFVTPWTVPARLLCPFNSPGKNTGVDCHSLLQGILTRGSNPGLLHCRWIIYHLSYQWSPGVGPNYYSRLWDLRDENSLSHSKHSVS